MVTASAALRTLAGALMKIANDVRWYASGPRAGIGELLIPENEPGSSIMPGKINPTQCEALTRSPSASSATTPPWPSPASQGNFQLNVYKPVMLHTLLESVELLAEAMRRLRRALRPRHRAEPRGASPRTSTTRSCW